MFCVTESVDVLLHMTQIAGVQDFYLVVTPTPKQECNIVSCIIGVDSGFVPLISVLHPLSILAGV